MLLLHSYVIGVLYRRAADVPLSINDLFEIDDVVMLVIRNNIE